MTTKIKRFILRALVRMAGMPMKEADLTEAVREAFNPPPPDGEINHARRELEMDGYIRGNVEEFDRSVTWTLTPKGEHKAKQLG